jgi:hypothetical protein
MKREGVVIINRIRKVNVRLPHSLFSDMIKRIKEIV